MKKNICPNCAGKIQPGSTICKHCGYTLEQKESVRPYEERYQEEETFEQGRPLDSDKNVRLSTMESFVAHIVNGSAFLFVYY